ncbi:hypothetical protein ACEQ8H_004379 [Pleosporales sp. CAS-2024a]
MDRHSLRQRGGELGPAHGVDMSPRDAACWPTCPRPWRAISASRASLLAVVALFLWSSVIGTCTATEALAWSGPALVIDHRAPPPAPLPLFMPSLPSNGDATHAATRAVTRDAHAHAANGTFTIPRPLDTGLSSNLTGSCAAFLQQLRAHAAFQDCHPFSLLLQTSSGFFDASKSYLRITQTLDATCGVNATQCKQTMDAFAKQIQSPSACKPDLDNDSPVVIQALNGLLAYPVAYSAACLRDGQGSYCFANAVSNTSSPTDSYPYYLPIGQPLPAGSRPTCNSCLQDAMEIFAQYGNDVTQPVSKTYPAAAQQISIACGQEFVNVTAAPVEAAAPMTSPSLTPTLTLLVMFILYFFH